MDAPAYSLEPNGLWFQQNTLLMPHAESAMGVLFYVDHTGRVYSLPTDQLPPAADPNDFHVNPLHAPPSLSIAAQSRILHLLTAPTDAAYLDAMPRISYGLQMRPGIFYDTGAFEGGSTAFRPGKIALDGSTDAHNRGRMFFNELENELQSMPARMQFNGAFGFWGIDLGQAYVDVLHLQDNQLRGRSAYIRSYAGNDGLLIGKAETAFGDLGSSPMLIATGGLPIGAVGIISESTNTFTSVSQLRYTRHWNNDALETTLSVEENRFIGDVDFGNQTPHFWPSFVGRVRLLGNNNFDSLQLAGLVRPIGFNNTAFEDHSTTAWGLSLIGRLCNESRRDAVYFGITGGNGIGGYIYGDIRAAVATSPTSIIGLDNFGAYAAYQHVWSQSGATMNLSSNLAYGYASADVFALSDNRRLHQAWCNLLWNASDNSAFGIEYQYGRREIGSGVDGDNHRIMFVAQFSTSTGRELAAQRESYLRDAGVRPIQSRRL